MVFQRKLSYNINGIISYVSHGPRGFQVASMIGNLDVLCLAVEVIMCAVLLHVFYVYIYILGSQNLFGGHF